MIEELKAASKQSFVPALFIALVYAGLEDKDQAFSWLDKAYEERFNRLAYLKVEVLWDPLPSDPRFGDGFDVGIAVAVLMDIASRAPHPLLIRRLQYPYLSLLTP
jgi:hypothetical protein